MDKLEALSIAIEKLHSHAAADSGKKKSISRASLETDEAQLTQRDLKVGKEDWDNEPTKIEDEENVNGKDEANEKKLVDTQQKTNLLDKADSVDTLDLSGIVLRNKAMGGVSKLALQKSNSLSRQEGPYVRNLGENIKKRINDDIVIIDEKHVQNISKSIINDTPLSSRANSTKEKFKLRNLDKSSNNIELIDNLDDGLADKLNHVELTALNIECESRAHAEQPPNTSESKRHSKDGHRSSSRDATDQVGKQHTNAKNVETKINMSPGADLCPGNNSLPHPEKTSKEETEMQSFHGQHSTTDPKKQKHRNNRRSHDTTELNSNGANDHNHPKHKHHEHAPTIPASQMPQRLSSTSKLPALPTRQSRTPFTLPTPSAPIATRSTHLSQAPPIPQTRTPLASTRSTHLSQAPPIPPIHTPLVSTRSTHFSQAPPIPQTHAPLVSTRSTQFVIAPPILQAQAPPISTRSTHHSQAPPIPAAQAPPMPSRSVHPS